jgi:hypothetical protein
MGIARHEPCVHGRDEKTCRFCVIEAKFEYFENRLEDLEAAVFEDPQPDTNGTVGSEPLADGESSS